MANDLSEFTLDISKAGPARLSQLVPVGDAALAVLFDTPNEVKLFAMRERMRASLGMDPNSGLVMRAQQVIDKWEEDTIRRLFPTSRIPPLDK